MDTEVPRKLWEHPNPQSTEMWKFMQAVNKKHHLQLKTFWDLHNYAVTKRSQFWDQLFPAMKLIYSGTYTEVVDEMARIDSLPRWFEGVNINFAENMLYSRSTESAESGARGTVGKEDGKIAFTQVREGGSEFSNITWGQLRREVAQLASAMEAHGVGKGDRVAAVAGNSIDILKVFLAVTTLGGIFSSSATDMGVKGVLDRILQIKPVWLFHDDFAVYNGKTVNLEGNIKGVIEGMKDIKEFKGVIVMSRFTKPPKKSGVQNCMSLSKFVSAATSAPEFVRVPFGDPFVIAYSSGTTGQPKCIVHGVGRCLLSSSKEARLHSWFDPSDVALQFTTTGWIMYLGQTLSLLAGARIVAYDGSPFLPDPSILLRLVEREKVTTLGVSPRWMMEIQRHGIVPRTRFNLSSLRRVSSTGMVLPDRLFEWFYDVAFPPSALLINMSGGTDVAGCFGLGNPLTPLYVGGCQGPSLGTAIEVYDQTIEGGVGVKGSPVPDGTPGELVAPVPFPTMPIKFWNDEDGSRYFNAYFAKYDNVWTHGDFVSKHPITGALIFHGRADGVLNPSGVRFGSAEIYNVLENGEFEDIQDSICVGQRRPQDDDETVLLFCLMKPGKKFSPKLVQDIKAAIRKSLSARHVPKYIFETPSIPTTINMKKVELPVKQIVSGQVIKASSTLANPQSLDYYYQFAKLEDLIDVKSRL